MIWVVQSTYYGIQLSRSTWPYWAVVRCCFVRDRKIPLMVVVSAIFLAGSSSQLNVDSAAFYSNKAQIGGGILALDFGCIQIHSTSFTCVALGLTL